MAFTVSTPIGFRDILGDEAEEREQIERRVQDLFASRGYAPVETPTLEAMDALQASGRAPSSPFKLFDSRGDLLAMRPDVTMQIARMGATRFAAKEGEDRKFRYTQRVFRDAEGEAQVGPRELTQMGVERIGAAGAEADAELIELMVQALGEAGVAQMLVAVATVGPLRELVAASGASAEWQALLLDAYHASDFVEVDKLCAGGEAEAKHAGAIRALPRVRGGREAIAEARRLTEPLGCAGSLEEFEQMYDMLCEAGLEQTLLVDFSVVSSFNYYSGLVFEAYSPHLGTRLGSGGRYDRLLGAFGSPQPAAGFAFFLEQAMEASAGSMGSAGSPDTQRAAIRIAVPKGALHADAVKMLAAAGLPTKCLEDIGRQMVVREDDVEYIIVRPSDAPAFVASGAADCGICGQDSLVEAQAQVVELVDLKFGACKFVVAQPEGAEARIAERYRRLGSIRVATKYPNVALTHYAKTGMQVEVVRLHGNIELAPLVGMAECILDITATGTTLRENNLCIAEDVMHSTARFFANPCAFRTEGRVAQIALKMVEGAGDLEFEPIAGASQN